MYLFLLMCFNAIVIFLSTKNLNYREPSTESDFLRQAISTSYSQKNNNARQGQNAELPRKENNYPHGGRLGASSSLTKLEQSTFVAPASPGQIRLAKESAAVKSLTLSRLQDKVQKILIMVYYRYHRDPHLN